MDILWALFSAKYASATGKTVLPTLHNLHVEELISIVGLLLEAKESFIALRRLSGCPIDFYEVRKQHSTHEGQEESY